MPRRIKYTRRNRKLAKWRRRAAAKNQRTKTKGGDLVLIPKPFNGGFPKQVFTTLKYRYTGVLNPGAGGTNSVQIFRCNSVYDPDATGVGNQPRGYDEWSALYNHMNVKRSKITVEYHNGDATYEQQVGIALRDGIATETNPIDYSEQMGVTRMLGRVGSSHNHIVLTKKWDCYKDLGVSYTNQKNQHSSSSNPGDGQYFHVYSGNPWGSDPSNAYISVTIYYDVLFSELKDLTQS